MELTNSESKACLIENFVVDKELQEIQGIDENNIYILLSTKIQRFNINEKTMLDIILIDSSIDSEITNISTLFFSKTIEFSEKIYLGLVGTDDGRLFICTEKRHENLQKSIEKIYCNKIKEFGKEAIKNIYVRNFHFDL